MGMRIKTGIGYGLDITNLDKEYLNKLYEEDQLFNDLSEKITEIICSTSFTTDKIFFNNQKDKPFLLQNHLVYCEEFFQENKIVIQPYPFGLKWSRYDDDIDYHQAAMLKDLIGEPTDVIYQESKHSIYPYCGLMRRNSEEPFGVESYTESCYLDRPDELDQKFAVIPTQILVMIKILFKLSDEEALDAFFKMTPVYYRYWS